MRYGGERRDNLPEGFELRLRRAPNRQCTCFQKYILMRRSYNTVENNVKKNLLDNEEEIYVNLNDLVNLRESAELKEAADAFERYLEDYARATHMPQSVLSDICHLSVQAAHRGMEFCFMKGFELGARVMRGALEEEMMEG